MNESGTRRRWKRRVAYVFCGVIVLWLIGDFVYSRVVAHQINRWEAAIERDQDGIQTGCREYTVGNGKTALLLVHGINDSPRCYRKMAPVLADQGFTCRVMRMPGFAKPIDEYASATQKQWISAVDAEVASLRKTHDRVCTIAHSLGGAVAISYLLDKPDAVDAVVLIAPAVEVSDERSPVLSTRAWHEFGQWALPFTSITNSPFENDAHDPAERDYPGRMIFTPKSIADQTFQLIDNNRERASDFKPPLMMVLSKDDEVIDWQAAERFYQDAVSTEKEIFFTKDAGHTIASDYGWEALARAIAKFCDE